MTTEVQERPKRRDMDDFEQHLADEIYKGIQRTANDTDRGRQAREFRVGLSDLGYCSERLRRMLLQEVPDDPDMLLAWLGTAIGDKLDDAIIEAFPGAIKQASVILELQGSKRTYAIPGHPDVIVPDYGLVLDGKTAEGLQLARRLGANQQQQFQRHGYGKAAWVAGHFGSLPLEEVKVGNVWLDRSGRERRVHVQVETFSDEVLFSMAHWLDEVVDSYERGVEAEKEPPRQVCEQTCGFFAKCRLYDTDARGLIEAPQLLAAVDLYLDGQNAYRAGERWKQEAKSALVGVSGSTGTHVVRWVDVGPSKDGKAGYSRLDVREID